jgi:chromosomal replication initiation ATPase DnaA
MKPTVLAIVKACADINGCSLHALTGKGRFKADLPLKSAIAVVAKMYGLSWVQIGHEMNRHHTSVIHLQSAWEHKFETRQIVNRLYPEVERRLKLRQAWRIKLKKEVARYGLAAPPYR